MKPEKELERILWEISDEKKKKLGQKLESVLIKSLSELQKNFDEIVLFNVKEQFAYSSQENEYSIILNKDGISFYNKRMTIREYVKFCLRYGDEDRFANPAFTQTKIAERVMELYKGKKEPKFIHWVID